MDLIGSQGRFWEFRRLFRGISGCFGKLKGILGSLQRCFKDLLLVFKSTSGGITGTLGNVREFQRV